MAGADTMTIEEVVRKVLLETVLGSNHGRRRNPSGYRRSSTGNPRRAASDPRAVGRRQPQRCGPRLPAGRRKIAQGRTGNGHSPCAEALWTARTYERCSNRNSATCSQIPRNPTPVRGRHPDDDRRKHRRASDRRLGPAGGRTRARTYARSRTIPGRSSHRRLLAVAWRAFHYAEATPCAVSDIGAMDPRETAAHLWEGFVELQRRRAPQRRRRPLRRAACRGPCGRCSRSCGSPSGSSGTAC